ncbi:hypothetical protein M404DRAFT_180040 [Pisolithus tinctorius Marx 270]|uniref:Uncharacterized protein n=1 Tax=Pisolithus tinctorius Marx 270 TaxID=870435 RepID=A0A0C3PYD4_PISTI|nr:hypothetical protein M404DRAFT_180040 [Pisolithus tinctorius Marx 270]
MHAVFFVFTEEMRDKNNYLATTSVLMVRRIAILSATVLCMRLTDFVGVSVIPKVTLRKEFHRSDGIVQVSDLPRIYAPFSPPGNPRHYFFTCNMHLESFYI